MSAPPCLSLKKRRSVTADELRRQCEEIIAASERNRRDPERTSTVYSARSLTPLAERTLRLLDVAEAAQLVRVEPWFQIRSEGSAHALYWALEALAAVRAGHNTDEAKTCEHEWSEESYTYSPEGSKACLKCGQIARG